MKICESCAKYGECQKLIGVMFGCCEDGYVPKTETPAINVEPEKFQDESEAFDMENKFNKKGFLAYLRYQVPRVFSINNFTRELVENLIDYAYEYKKGSKDQFCYFLSDIIPEIEFGEVAVFMDNEYLTESYGIPEKNSTIEEMDIRLEAENGVTRVFVGGEELYL